MKNETPLTAFTTVGVLPKMHDEVLNLEKRRYGHGLTVPDMISGARMQRAARLGPALSKGTVV